MDTGTDILIEFNPLRCFNPRPTLFRVTSSLVKQNGPIQRQSENADLLDTAVNRSRCEAKPCVFIVLYQTVAPISQSLSQSEHVQNSHYPRGTLFHLFHLHLMIQHLWK